jgi:integrase
VRAQEQIIGLELSNTENEVRTEAELEPLPSVTLHECRHTFASLMIAAGI